jgi:hypothetical protein
MTSNDRPIFLVGCPRSGTTLLSAMLHAHPRIAMPPETRFLVPLYHDRLSFGDLRDPANRRRLAWRMTGKGTRFRDLGLDRRQLVGQIVAAPPTFGSAAGTVWREFARSRGKVRWGEKRPAYWQDMDLILRLFPSAQIVHLVRDGRACVASLKQVDWWHSGAIGGMATWVLADRELTRLGRRLPADCYHRVRYEDLLADPPAELGALCGFLGEEFDEAMLDHTQAARDIVPDRKSWHDRTKGSLDPARIEAWRTALDPAEIALLERVGGRVLRANGYEISGVGSRVRAGDLAAYCGSVARIEAGMRRHRIVDAWVRRRHPQLLADCG